MNVSVDIPEPVEPTVTITLTLDEARKLRALVGAADDEMFRALFAHGYPGYVNAAFDGSVTLGRAFTHELFDSFNDHVETQQPPPWGGDWRDY